MKAGHVRISQHDVPAGIAPQCQRGGAEEDSAAGLAAFDHDEIVSDVTGSNYFRFLAALTRP